MTDHPESDTGNTLRQDRLAPQVRSAIWFLIYVTVLLLVLWAAADLLLIIFMAILFAVFFRGLSNPIAKKTGISQPIALWAVIVAFTILTGLTWLLIWEVVASQLQTLLQRLPEAFAEIRSTYENSRMGEVLSRFSTDLREILQSKQLLTRATGIMSSTLGFFSSGVVVVVAGLFLAHNPSLYRDGFLRLFLPRRRARMREILDDLYDTARWWLLGKSLSMIIVGVATWIGLEILGLQLALALGSLAAVLAFIPYIGPVLAAIPAILLALVMSPVSAVKIVLLYLVIQLIESNFLSPLIAKRMIQLPPALTIFSQMLAGYFFGFLGILLASPLCAVTMVAVRKMYVEDQLEKNNSHSDSHQDGSSAP